MKRAQRQAFKDDIKWRKTHPRGTDMLAKQKWQAKTIKVLDEVFEERVRQFEKHGDAMAHLPDGTGPDVEWLTGVLEEGGSTDLNMMPMLATDIEAMFRQDYEERRAEPGSEFGQLTRMHLVREEIAEAFKEHGDSPEFRAEIIQVAALCVQWAEYKS